MNHLGAEKLDDLTVAYVLETRKWFEDLRQVAAQLAGLLVLEAAGAKSEVPGHPMLAAASELHQSAADGIHHTRATARARRHHHHLLDAADALGSALSAAHTGVAIDPILAPLRVAYARLQDAGKELPGFEMVALAQGCCGVRGQ